MDPAILSHFQSVDPILFTAAQRVAVPTLTASDNYFLSLVESIVSQQLSVKASDTIMSRFWALFPTKTVTAEMIMKISDDQLRAVGMSWGKVRYVKNLSEKVNNNEIQFELFKTLPEAEIIDELVKVKGIGKWTAEMFLMFTLGRPDIFSTGDLGLKRAIQKMYNLKKEPTEKQLLKLSKKWSPYRTYACRVLWRTLDQK